MGVHEENISLNKYSWNRVETSQIYLNMLHIEITAARKKGLRLLVQEGAKGQTFFRPSEENLDRTEDGA
jgi:hypothetical protein